MELLLIDTEHTIGPVTEEESRRYNEIGRELQETAQALLATVRHLLCGPELTTCESASHIEESDAIDAGCLMRLQIQFSREIAQWKETHA